MRIAQISPLRVAVPPRDYGGTERCVANLTESLVQLGHDVTLFASGDSQTRARLVPMVPEALNFDPAMDSVAYHYAALAKVYRQAGQFDMIHSHMDYLTLHFASLSDTPTVLTLHGRLDRPEFGCVLRQFCDANYVAISKNQQSALPDLHWVGVVHHGVDVETFRFYPESGDYMVFVGRIAPEKGPERAIEIATRTGIPLKIAAKVDPTDREYFEDVVKPLLDHPLIEFLGPVDEMNKRELIGNALALIVPIDWPEPFGIVFIEALACGTPVLTCPYGAAPELLEDGLTGYMCHTLDELAEAAVRVRRDISRARCRAYAKRRFDAERMARNYEAVYEKVRSSHDTFALPSGVVTVSTRESRKSGAVKKPCQLATKEMVGTNAKLAVAKKSGLLATLPMDANSDTDESAFVP
jgi:glycosyltransferase involved in cell wall biosynthesis